MFSFSTLLQEPRPIDFLFIGLVAFGFIIILIGIVAAVKRRLNPPPPQKRDAYAVREDLSLSVRYLLALILFASGYRLAEDYGPSDLGWILFFLYPIYLPIFIFFFSKFVAAVYRVSRDTHSLMLFALFLCSLIVFSFPVSIWVSRFPVLFLPYWTLSPLKLIRPWVAFVIPFIPYALIYVHARRYQPEKKITLRS